MQCNALFCQNPAVFPDRTSRIDNKSLITKRLQNKFLGKLFFEHAGHFTHNTIATPTIHGSKLAFIFVGVALKLRQINPFHYLAYYNRDRLDRRFSAPQLRPLL
ncbi:hypothetical protein [Xenorhabdus sp. PB62.4]|uniref:hypothetical protein n=1 Tax=Xenorhabdus sp. PB62.4 TaxID=1851573 RepID=UPI001656BA67|nr:hypothetical protein [Xenorhabdus sp. PB62.4]